MATYTPKATALSDAELARVRLDVGARDVPNHTAVRLLVRLDEEQEALRWRAGRESDLDLSEGNFVGDTDLGVIRAEVTSRTAGDPREIGRRA